jgi:hypothetical protein
MLAKALAPYVAVGIFWCFLSNGWLAILGYHAQVLLWGAEKGFTSWRPRWSKAVWLAVPGALTGPLVVALLPYMTRVSLPAWLADHRLTGASLVLMIPYFGLVHPLLEQIHWAPLRAATPLAHPGFAGYHLLVLYSLLTLPWLIVCFVVLTLASWLWHVMTRRSGSVVSATLLHVVADLSMVVVAWWLVRGG